MGAAAGRDAERSFIFAPPVYQYYATARIEPASLTTTEAHFIIQYQYTDTGYLKAVVNALNPSRVYWQATATDARGQVSAEIFGNGVQSTRTYNPASGYLATIKSGLNGGNGLQNLAYVWEPLGNLSNRNDGKRSLNESFSYDTLNRLTGSVLTNGSGNSTTSYAYDAIGNITDKSDRGTYTYGGTAGPHAVTSVAGLSPGTYQYDADGNMTNRAGTTIAWNSDNLPTQITQDASNTSTFSYAPDKHRYYQTAKVNGTTETTIYVGNMEIVSKNGTTDYRQRISAYGRDIGEYIVSTDVSHDQMTYVLTDHLGSVDVITDESGAPISGTGWSFGAFGKRRDATSWSGSPVASVVSADRDITHRGFTNQEMLDNVDLEHFGGRLYSPELGRFLSVDPVFQFPTNTQSLNPYSYVLNNPLSLTDPSGYTATDGSICTGPGGASRGCVGQDVKDLKGQLVGKLFGQLQAAVHKAYGKNATVAAFGTDKNGNSAMVLTYGNGGSNSESASVPADQNKGASDKGGPTSTGRAKLGESGASRLINGLVSKDDMDRLNALKGMALWHAMGAYNDFIQSGTLPDKWKPFFGGSAGDIFGINWQVLPGFMKGQTAATCFNTHDGCAGAQNIGGPGEGTVEIYGAAIITRGWDNIRDMTGLVLHEFEHSNPYNKKIYSDWYSHQVLGGAEDLLHGKASKYFPWADRPWEIDANEFSDAAMKFYRN